MWNNMIITWISSFILGMGVITPFIVKNIKKTKRYLKIAKESLDLVEVIVSSLEMKPGETKSNLTIEELEQIQLEWEHLQNALKKE